ncbi:protein phosphatase 1 regulatory subunit 14A-like isoform X2 [Sinocyclocheilus anshuiensis]|uniref:protein phosphatase 1 regulatory subunit 14A-like isoform X2 n=1 Tax=Sinocyclocheilus anshuiensis TaxID=1608454 RepID=UPI0007B9027B|nr:PREDICTED: protein phosphatase 1 regulatory subunit 14A-like isoform X2 [Sinocyclocheilus anshuiensis]
MQVSIRRVSLEMAAYRMGRRYNNKIHSPNRGTSREAGLSVQKRQARVTVKYNRKELQRRLDVEKWIDCGLDELYLGREEDMPEEVNIDELLDLQSDEERMQKLKVFITELVNKLHGLQKQEDLHNNGIEHPQLHIFPDCQGSPDTERN